MAAWVALQTAVWKSLHNSIHTVVASVPCPGPGPGPGLAPLNPLFSPLSLPLLSPSKALLIRTPSTKSNNPYMSYMPTYATNIGIFTLIPTYCPGTLGYQ
jgi:hypothetical protein